MSLSLDMTGKFVLVTLMIAVITGLIINFQGDINSSVGQLLGGDNEDTGANIVEIDSSNPGQKLSSMIDSCYQRSLENSVEDSVCFIARSDQGFSFEDSQISETLSEEVRDMTEFKQSSYDTESVVIRYSSVEGNIVVE